MNQISSDPNPLNQVSTTPPGTRTEKSRQSSNGGFNEILIDQMKTADSPSSSDISPTLPEIDGQIQAEKIRFDLHKSQPVPQLDGMLNLLDQYAKILQDPDKPLKQAWQILEQLTRDTQSLDDQFKKDTLIDNDLKGIVDHLLTTVELEQIKFRRGDYA